MAKNYVVAIILEGKDKDLKKTMRQAGVQVDDFADKAEAGGQRIQRALTGAAIAMTFGKSIPLMRKAIDLYAQAESATTSLGSAAKYAGVDFNKALGFLEDYTEDGLMPLAQATLSLKNLLLAGYGLERSMEMLRALKDFAAYGRQGQLSMGEAVQRATEGLKNQMSQLVDNAGLTKNLAVMYREYAATIGKGAGSLSEAEKVTAAYVGTMKEWGAVEGDASKASVQLVGDMARQDAKMRVLYETLGKGLEPAYRQLLKPLGDATEGITNFARVNPEATATLLGGAGLVAAVGALAAAFALMGPAGAVVVGIAAAIVGIATVSAKLRAEQAHLTERLKTTAIGAETQASKIRALLGEYKELSKHTEPTKEDQERIDEISVDLASSIPGVTTALLDQKGAWEGAETAVGAYLGTLRAVSEAAINTLKVQRGRILDELAVAEKAYSDKAKIHYPEFEDIPEGMSFEDFFGGIPLEAQVELEKLHAIVLNLREDFLGVQGALDAVGVAGRAAGEEVKTGLDETTTVVEEVGTSVGETTKAIDGWNAAMDVFFEQHARLPQSFEDWQEFLAMLRENLPEAAEDIDEVSAKLGTFEQKLKRGTQGWGDFGQFGVDAISEVTDAFGASLGRILLNTGDTSEQLREIWSKFFDWIVMEIARVAAQWVALKILQTIFPGFALPGAEGGTVERAAGGGTLVRAAGGGVLRGSVAGFDRVPVLAQIDETFLSTDLTRRIDRMVGDYESSRSVVPVQTPVVPTERMGGDQWSLTLVTPDAATFGRMLRSGELGREFRRARDHNRLPRRG